MSQPNPQKTRRRIGAILSLLGVLLNLMLFLLKAFIGKRSGSVAVTADGFNNLADAGSCVLTLTGFLLGSQRPSRAYPMGRGRWEYLSGVLISAAVLMIGGRMLLSSVVKILHPSLVDGRPAVVIVLLISILVKGAMFLYYRVIGKRLCSPAMRAAEIDSLSDCCATAAILSACLIEKLTGLRADGWIGVPVALCILYAGVCSFKESAKPLLGRRPDDETEEQLRQIAAGVSGIRSIEGIMLHDYGSDSRLLTFFAQTDDPQNDIPALQKEIKKQTRMEAIVSPATFKSGDRENNPTSLCPQYRQTKETQECEANEHQTR